VDATLRALELPASSLPQQREAEVSPAERFRADHLWAQAQMVCYEQQIDPALVGSRQEIGELYRAWTKGEPLDDLHVMTGWRRQACGQSLLTALQQRSPSARARERGL
jgi:ribonuclease D